jgi:uncharacterized protein (TIGR03382 family)
MPSQVGIQSWYGPAIDDVNVTAVPEPSGTMPAVGVSLVILMARRRSWQMRHESDSL